MTKEGKVEYAHAVGIAAAHNPTEPWRIITAVTNDAARSELCESEQRLRATQSDVSKYTSIAADR